MHHLISFDNEQRCIQVLFSQVLTGLSAIVDEVPIIIAIGAFKIQHQQLFTRLLHPNW